MSYKILENIRENIDFQKNSSLPLIPFSDTILLDKYLSMLFLYTLKHPFGGVLHTYI